MGNIKSFAEYVAESSSIITICLVDGMGIPNKTHEKVFETAFKVAGKGGRYRIYPLVEEGEGPFPLEKVEAIKTARKMFPRHARSIIHDDSVRSIREALFRVYQEGYMGVRLVVPFHKKHEAQRVVESCSLVFPRGIGIIESSKGINIQAKVQKIVESAKANEYGLFAQEMPDGYAETKSLYTKIRKSMGYEEPARFHGHIKLSSVSDIREKYIAGNLLDVGDHVVVTETGKVGTVCVLGPNYVLVEYPDTQRVRHWLESVQRIGSGSMSGNTPSSLASLLTDQVCNTKYRKCVRYHIDRVGLNGSRQDLITTAKIADLSFRMLEKTLHSMINEGILPPVLATRAEMVENKNKITGTLGESVLHYLLEESEVDKVKAQRQKAEMDLDREYTQKMELAKRRDEIDDEQARRRKEAAGDDDDETDDDGQEQ